VDLLEGDRACGNLWPNSIQAVGRKEFPAAWCSVVSDSLACLATRKKRKEGKVEKLLFLFS
jgi:hypothetical protein